MSPFLCDGPTCISFSGGRTSGYMLHRILQAHDGALPADTHVVFANTGRERLETLVFINECAGRWNVPIRWVERDGSKPSWQRFREVTYATASRDGEPFAELIAERSYLPNVVARFCTEELKIKRMRDFMRAQGHDHWTNVVGLRFDEPNRVARLRSPERHERWDVACPLYDARITKTDVMAFWRSQCFDLRLQSYEGNCDLCFLKGRGKRERIMRERPDLAAWWIEQERTVTGLTQLASGARFRAHEPSYAATLDRVRRMPLLPMDLSGEDTIPCMCTD